MQGVNWKGRTALHCAAIANRPLSVSLLLLHGAKKDVLSKDRVTAIEDADLRSHERCKALLETAIESLSTRKCQAIMADDVPLLSSLPWEACVRLSVNAQRKLCCVCDGTGTKYLQDG